MDYEEDDVSIGMAEGTPSSDAVADAMFAFGAAFSSDASRFKRFSETGRDLFVSGAVTSHGGNLSETDGKNIWISRRGSMLGRMTRTDIMCTGWNKGPEDEQCSRELVVHRAIYHALAKATEGKLETPKAIVHAHTTHTIFRSMFSDEIVPLDSEGAYVMGCPAPVLSPEITIESPEAAEMLAHVMSPVSEGGLGVRIAVLRKHGPFAVADTLDGAFQLVSCLEAASKILNLRDATGAVFL